MRLYGAGSLAGDVLTRCGFRNAWQGGVNSQGEAMVELARIGAEDAGLILLPEEGQLPLIQRWQSSLLWQRLPLTSQPQLAFPAQKFNSGGALITAMRIAEALGNIVTGWRHG